MSEPTRDDDRVPPTLRDELPPAPEPLGLAPRIAVGCVTTVAGVFSGGMVFVLIGRFVGFLAGCEPEPGLPACHWHLYAAAGMLIGGISLPILALRRLRSAQPPRVTNPERGGSGTS